MSGGYISCGEFIGGDKTGTAFFEMLEDIVDVITPAEKPAFKAELVLPLQEQLADQEDDEDEAEEPVIALSRPMMNALVPPMKRYLQRTLERLKNPAPETWRNIGQGETGEGWRLICAQDLLKAYEACIKSGEDVIVQFD